MSSAIFEAGQRYDWRFIKCQPGSKNPYVPGGHHEYLYANGAMRWVEAGGNIGLTGTNLVVLDFDDAEGREMMFAELGPLDLTVETARGKFHSYFAADPTLPGKMRLPDGKIIGEIRRKPTEYVVAPPSVWTRQLPPGFTGGAYKCLVDRIELAPLPYTWDRYLKTLQLKDTTERKEPFVVPERIDGGGDGRAGLGRHETFFLWTRSCKGQGFTLEMTLEIMRLANENITFPPLDPYHLQKEVERAWRKEDSTEFKKKGKR